MIDKLTSRELEIARMVSEGMSVKDIADYYGYHHQSMSNILGVIYRKLGYRSGCKQSRLAVDYVEYRKKKSAIIF